MNGLQRIKEELRTGRARHTGSPLRACVACGVVRPVSADDICRACQMRLGAEGREAARAKWSAEERHELAGRWRSLPQLDLRTRTAHVVVLTGRRWAVVVRELVRQGFLKECYLRAYVPRGKKG